MPSDPKLPREVREKNRRGALNLEQCPPYGLRNLTASLKNCLLPWHTGFDMLKLQTEWNVGWQIRGRDVMEGRWGWAGPNQGLQRRDWRSLRLLTDVPPSPLKGLLTHFDYSGPVVTENITSIKSADRTALFFSGLPGVRPLPPTALGPLGSKQSTNYVAIFKNTPLVWTMTAYSQHAHKSHTWFFR